MLVDAEDYESLYSHKWGLTPNGYAVRRHKRDGKTTTLAAHREIMGLKVGDEWYVDHKNGNKLDNRRENLRLCTNRENQWNQKAHKDGSGLKGVCFDKKSGRWQTSIKNGKKVKYLGQYDSKEEAHEVYCLWADMLHGEFVRHA